MTYVLKATNEQYNSLNKYKKGNNELSFIKDNDDNWIVSKSVLSDPMFIEIRSELEQLEEILYNPIILDPLI